MDPAGPPIGRIDYNVAAASCRQEHFVARLLSRLEGTGTASFCLELAVTETVLLERVLHTVSETFQRLRSAGMTIAWDDLGTGYGSLIHLKQFPVDLLKIDRSFVQSLENSSNAATVRAMEARAPLR